MPESLLNLNTSFWCNMGSYNLKPIVSKSEALDQGATLLTDLAQLLPPPGSICMVTGNPCPCIPQNVAWSKSNDIIKLGKSPILTEKSEGNCGLGGIIQPINSSRKCKIGSSNVSSINMLKVVPKVLVVKETFQKQVSLQENQILQQRYDNDNQNKDEASQLEKDKYACCNYQNCPEAKNCEYLNTVPFIKNDSIVLRKNLKNTDAIKEYEFVYEKCKKKTANGDWSCAAHHLICGNQVFLAKDDTVEGNLLFGKLVKLALFAGYDINCAENGILLPTKYMSGLENEGIFGDTQEITKKEAKRADGFDVMSLMGRQWHEGGHSYQISREDLRFFKDTDISLKRNIWQYQSTELFPIYASLVKSMLRKLQSKYRRERCWKKRMDLKTDGITNREKLLQELNDISATIAGCLKKFKNNPQESYPFYVSRLAVLYSYNLPRAAKLIVVYRDDKQTLHAIRYRVERYKKNNLKIVFKKQNTMTLSGSEASNIDFVFFCENARHFLIDNKSNYSIPFPSQGDVGYVTRIISLQTAQTGKYLEPLREYLEKYSYDVMSFLESEYFPYVPIQTAVVERILVLD